MSSESSPGPIGLRRSPGAKCQAILLSGEGIEPVRELMGQLSLQTSNKTQKKTSIHFSKSCHPSSVHDPVMAYIFGPKRCPE